MTGAATNVNGQSTEAQTSVLLSLPKELRLQIWRHVIVPIPCERPVLRIGRQDDCSNMSNKRFANSLYKHVRLPQIWPFFHKDSGIQFNASLLQTNRLIYAEALPLLYHSVTFCPWDLQGIFPLFLENLSAFAKSHIRYVRLDLGTIYSSATSYFYWSLTCAQVATLKDSLRQVEVTGEWAHSRLNKHALLYPLLKIQAPKKLVDGCDIAFQTVLGETAEELKAKTKIRKATTAADSMARKLTNLHQFDNDHPVKKSKLEGLAVGLHIVDDVRFPDSDERYIAHDLAALPGIEQFEKELLEWDMVDDEDEWNDTASTMICKDTISSHQDFVDWELVDGSSPS
ncbi:hypothetical protein BDU57DRAFT_461618 [Ampelomyces quisqualis]|uniref:Uncharacterized protein n=1 Tax=Ampelomyces quisqualis TaxID=50730 RepID=A0A6A5Q9Q0_AMPQU|nr:hypothetical protein BDU57DRAFT_461618 [Ampelomyces quisqualis]